MKSLLSVTLSLLAAIFVAAAETPDPETLQNKIQISLGERLFVSFQRNGDALSAPELSQKVGNKPDSLSLRFERIDDMALLVTKNPFGETLRFRALAKVKGSSTYFETSILPISAKLSSYESWQDDIETLILFDFSLSKELDQ